MTSRKGSYQRIPDCKREHTATKSAVVLEDMSQNDDRRLLIIWY